jgi:hypothetical protein
MNLNHIKSRLQRPLHRRLEGLFEILNIPLTHLLRLGMVLVPRDRARRVNIVRPAVQVFAGHGSGRKPGRHGAGLSTRVAELNHYFLALRVRELADLRQGGDLAVFPEPDIFRGDAALGGYGGGFDARDGGASLEDAAHVLWQSSVSRFSGDILLFAVFTYGKVPHGIMPIFSGVLAQRREGDAVLEGEAAELEGFEEFGDGFGFFGDESGSCGGVLGGCEVRGVGGGFVDVVGFFFNVCFDGVVGGHGGWC